jgi:hypothetical protein
MQQFVEDTLPHLVNLEELRMQGKHSHCKNISDMRMV